MTDSYYLSRLKKYLDKLDTKTIENFVNQLIIAESNKSSIFIVGNGGSASTASHMTTDLASLSSNYNFNLAVVSLVDNSSLITAVANDFDFDLIFSSQLYRLAKPRDLLILFSASGNSPNLISAVESANEIGMESFGFLGFDGGIIKNIIKKYSLIDTEIGDYGPVEDIHLVINHMIKELLIEHLKSNPKYVQRGKGN